MGEGGRKGDDLLAGVADEIIPLAGGEDGRDAAAGGG